MTVVDSSVYIAAINAHEPHHEASRRWFEVAVNTGQDIWAPALFLSEVSAAIGRGLENPLLALETVERLRNSSIVRLAPVDINLAERAAAIAARHRIRGCDAIYVALAERLSIPLITLDRQQLTRASTVIATSSPSADCKPTYTHGPT
ncbi:MAG: type II toxin-antitoxin system VapC family toxin [Caldilineaceae bacterium]|nr:type II toxin-antitoxin system VapC family toxin [Caldilineaceae bacterium]